LSVALTESYQLLLTEGVSVYNDKTLTCRDCGQNFTFTAGEQEFFAQKGFTNEPTRCPDCRSARKRNNDSYSGGGYSTGGGYERREREMFPAVCSSCGKDTQVPFQPRNDRPVYCSDCFATQRGSSYSGGGGGGRDRNRW
jgi:CxxC-x17-CxxC domain-containing protein